jgi:hypothetical protein
MRLRRVRSGWVIAAVLACTAVLPACAAASQAATGSVGGQRHVSRAAGQHPAHTAKQHPAHAASQQVSHIGGQHGVVLVNQPARRVCAGRTFTVGVWFQQTGGSRAYRLSVYNPHHKRVFFRRGQAPSSHWAFWKIRATRAGTYHTAYSAHWRSPSAWTIYRTPTKARTC